MTKINLQKIVKEVNPTNFKVGEIVRIYIDQEINSTTLEVREGKITNPNYKTQRGMEEINKLQMEVYRTGRLVVGEGLDYSHGPRAEEKNGKLKGKPYLGNFMYCHIAKFEKIPEPQTF
ncbi:MAG: hypothetical protein AABW50_04665 [Nanoarchaeota archaeon]